MAPIPCCQTPAAIRRCSPPRGWSSRSLARAREIRKNVAAAIKFLLERGADAKTVDNEGNTALHGVAIWGSNAAVEMLVAAGARLDVKNKEGRTPWRIAEGAVFEDAVLAQPQTAALLRRLMDERGLKVE